MTLLTEGLSSAPEATAPRPHRPPEEPPETPVDRPRDIARATLDDRLSVGGALVASLAVVWLVYSQLLPLTGSLGYLVSCYLVFLVFYAVVTAQSSPRPVVKDRLVAAVVTGGAVVVGLGLVVVVVSTLYKGFPAYSHPNFFTSSMDGVRPDAPMNQGGILHAVVGTLIEVGIAVAIALPLGVGAGVYMNEIGGRFVVVVRTVVEAMTALPDLVAGLFIYTVLIVGLGQERTGLAAALAIAITMLPIIARSSEVVLRVVPGGLREAGVALGASQWQTVRRVVLPTARPGLATALILGIARGIGETAPVLIVSGASTFLNYNPTSNPMNSLPLFTYFQVRNISEPNSVTRGYGAASVLLMLVVILFVAIRLLARNRADSR